MAPDRQPNSFQLLAEEQLAPTGASASANGTALSNGTSRKSQRRRKKAARHVVINDPAATAAQTDELSDTTSGGVRTAAKPAVLRQPDVTAQNDGRGIGGGSRLSAAQLQHGELVGGSGELTNDEVSALVALYQHCSTAAGPVMTALRIAAKQIKSDITHLQAAAWHPAAQQTLNRNPAAVQMSLIEASGSTRHLRSASIPEVLLQPPRGAASDGGGVSDSDTSTAAGYASADGDVFEDARHQQAQLPRSLSR